MRAIMEVLQAPDASSSSSEMKGSGKDEALGEVGGSLEERDVLLDSLSSIRSGPPRPPQPCLRSQSMSVPRTPASYADVK